MVYLVGSPNGHPEDNPMTEDKTLKALRALIDGPLMDPGTAMTIDVINNRLRVIKLVTNNPIIDHEPVDSRMETASNLVELLRLIKEEIPPGKVTEQANKGMIYLLDLIHNLLQMDTTEIQVERYGDESRAEVVTG